jgi:hypothetical protein
MTMPRRSVATRLEGLSIIDALAEPSLLGQSLVGGVESWRPWLAFLKAFFGLPMDDSEAQLYRACTGRHGLPCGSFQTIYLICGRGAGKSFVLALIAVYLSCFRDWSSKLAPGGKPVVLLIAPTREQAKIDLAYIVGILEASPVLRKLVTNVTANTVELHTGVVVECGVPNYRSVRGRSVCCALIDEVAFLRSEESANPDVEVVAAVTPSLGRFGTDGVLLLGSTPYSKRGVLYDGFREYHGNETGEALCWKSPTRTMNPTYSQELIDRELAKDRAKFGAEYLAEWRDDLEAFISRESIEACVQIGIRERGPVSNVKYFGFVDPSGGGPDAYTLGIAHREDTVVVLDAVRDRHGSTESITSEYATLLQSYGISSIHGDNYAGEWPKEAFARYGITYLREPKVRSEIYLATLPLINSRRVEFLDNPKMVLQFANLVRQTSPGGKDSINHQQGSHDDICNAVAGVLVHASVGAAPLNFHAPHAGLGRSVSTVDPSSGLPAAINQGAYPDGGSMPPGGWPAGSPQLNPLGGNLGWWPGMKSN